MKSGQNTADRIAATARHLFNANGFAATSLTEIAAAIGISQGNLTYHFATKQRLVERLEEDLRTLTGNRRESRVPGDVADDYVEHLIFAMTLTWDYRFLLRDRMQFKAGEEDAALDPEMMADFRELRALLGRMEASGAFRKDLSCDLDVLSRSLWIISRYWLDHLHEFEGARAMTWADQLNGIRHHFAVLLPYLSSRSRSAFEEALSAHAPPDHQNR